MKIKHVFDEVYSQNYYFIRCPTHKKFREAIKKELNLDLIVKNGTDGECVIIESKGQNICLIWVKDSRPEILAHECLHAVNYVLEMRGMKLSLRLKNLIVTYCSF